MERVTDLADPNRCQGSQPDGQCQNVSAHGSKYCPACGGKSTELADARTAYILKNVRWRERLAALRGQDQVASLREEIAMCRMMIEMIYNRAKDETDLLAASNSLNTLFLTLDRLLKTTNQLEFKVGAVLSKTTVIVIARELITHIIDEINTIPGYEEKIDRIAERMYKTIENTTNVEQNQ